MIKVGENFSLFCMEDKTKIAIFKGMKIRRHWDEKQEKWYFSIVDIVEILTDSSNPTDYFKKLRKRDFELGVYIGTNCPQVEMITDRQIAENMQTE